MKKKLYQDAHLHIKRYSAPDISPKIGRIFLNSCTEEDFHTVRNASNSKVLPFFGFHPWFLSDADNRINQIESELTRNVYSCIGECGLDFSPGYRDSRELQIKVFRFQLELAKRYCRPVSVHCVKAWQPLIECLQDFQPFKAPFILHSFYGSKETVNRLIKLGAYISVSSMSLNNPEKSYPVIRDIPDDRLLIESDIRIGGNDYTIDKHLKILENNYTKISGIKEISVEILKAMVWQNGSIFTN